MLRIHRRDLGVLILLGFLVTIASVPVAHAYTASGGNTGQGPIDPQFGAGGGGPGGNGTADPDEYGIYTRPIPTNPNVQLASSSMRADTPAAASTSDVSARVRIYGFLYRLFGGLTN